MRNGFLVSATLLRDVAGRDPVCEGRTAVSGLLEMIGQQLRLRRTHEPAVEFLQRGGDALVADLTSALQQTGIGHIAGQSMVERIDGVWRRAASGGQPGRDQLVEPLGKLHLRQ